MTKLNFLWQDHSGYDNSTADAVAKLNPAKLIINVDGPGSDFPTLNAALLSLN